MADDMTTPSEDEILALAKKATPGPWAWTAEDCSMAWLHGADALADHVITSEVCNNCQESIADKTEWVWGRCSTINADNAAYIAAANPSAIIALIERHRAEVEELRDEADRWAKRAGQYAAERDRLEYAVSLGLEIAKGEHAPRKATHDEFIRAAESALSAGPPMNN